MRKIALFIALTAVVSTARAEDKTALAEAAEAVKPAAEAYSDYIQKSVNQIFASGKGATAEAAKRNLAEMDRKERESNRGVRKTVKECIKPNGLIDDDVKECTEGLRVKTW